jgi:uncharacterized protein YchJ
MPTACPCGSGAAEAACCGPIIAGAAAPTAIALMRSRYTAYVRGAIDHVIATHAAQTRAEVDRDAATRWSHDTQWLGLEIVASSAGGPTDDDGTSSSSRAASPAARRSRSASGRGSGAPTAAGTTSTAPPSASRFGAPRPPAVTTRAHAAAARSTSAATARDGCRRCGP